MRARGAFVRAKPEHAAQVAATLRASDRLELAALGVEDAAARLAWALTLPGDVRAVLDGQGRAVAIFGVAELAPGLGAPWMLCAEGVTGAARFIVRHGARRVRAWLKRWPVLTNATHAGNRLHHKFIEHCGFGWRGELSVNGHAFRVFELCAIPSPSA